MKGVDQSCPIDHVVRPIESLTIDFQEARQLTGVSRNTLYKLVQRGLIPGAQKLGGTWRFHREKLVGFLACEELGTPSKSRRR